MADVTATTLLSTLNIAARDGSDISFTPQEKTRAITKAINDPFVTKLVRDNSVTTVANTDNYGLPFAGTLLKLGLQTNTYGRPMNIDNWDVVDGTLYLPYVLPTGKQLIMIGLSKLASTDPIPDNMQEYVIILAKINLLKYLQMNLATTFLTNDISMAELLRLEADLSAEAAMWRATIRNSFTTEL
jgi:hypothetical protein